ncbi:MAG: recombinase family protein [Fimbriimonas sp.]
MERAVAYIRVSDLRQAVDGNSLTSQESLVREYAARKSYELDSLWIEEGETAKTADRPVLQKLLRDLAKRRGAVSVLIFPKIDRFARYVEDYTALKGKLKILGVRLESVGERLEDTPVGRFTEMVLASVAQFDNEVRAERCRGGMVQAVREGRWVWKAPIGYRNVRLGNQGKKGGLGTIEPDPRTSVLVRRAFERIASGDRQVDVLDWLERQGLRLNPAGFGKMLRNKVYIGQIEAFGLVTPASPPFVPILDANLFREVQIALARGNRTSAHDRDNPDFPLRGTVRCECGNYLTACWSTGERKRYPYYRCLTCERSNFGREAVEGAFLDELAALRPHPGWLEAQRNLIQTIWRIRIEEKPRRIAEIRGSIREIDRLCDALADQTARGVIPEETAKRRFAALELERMELEHARDGYSKTDGSLTEVIEFAARFLGRVPEYWEGASIPAKKKLQSFLFPTGVVYTRNGSLRTSDLLLLEQIKHLLHAADYPLVDPCMKCPNQELLDWLTALREGFDVNLREVPDD